MSHAIAEQARRHGRLAIDTEFMSEGRYQALLCLVQVAVPDPSADNGVRTDVLDPLDEQAPLDHRPLAEVLADPAVEIVLHAGRQDIAILRRTWETEVTNVFDTQVAAGFVGMGVQEGYETLVRKVLGVQLRGGEGFTRWERRPLDERQLAYAADDARCLLALGTTLQAELEQVGRLDWARQESRLIETSSDVRSAERSYLKLPRIGRLTGRQRATAKRLVEWREETAREIDRPPSHIIPDPALLELARRAPTDKAGLEQIRGLPQATLHRRTKALLAAIESARELEANPPPKVAGRPRDAADVPIVSIAQAVLRQRAREAGIAPELIATQSELAALVGLARRDGVDSDPDNGVRALHGWRRELVGDELCDLAAGRLAVSVGGKGEIVVHEL